MMGLARAVAVGALVVAVAGCDRTMPDDPTGTPWAVSPSAAPVEFALPSLRLPGMAPDGTCPVTEPHSWADPEQASRVFGPGPVYPIADYFPDGALPLRDGDRQQDGSYTAKVRWLATGYTGPVLLRAAPIDGAGSASAKFSYLGETRDDGHHAVLTSPDTDLPGTTTVSGPGCYAYQVDGTSFSFTIVFRAER
ncbi:hypothetical protein KIF24_31685 [Micromonospora sp. Llam7]|uniref:hypothetical protein n=1 Tax=Micromonospora tarapacensis TaxID=2835305 RepID=UPI001C82F017|nr:hypothetical protein [Micromonospora tarapacensis]MBX7270135.1 hypothetical protein [Micromonospora tarapacensis]